MQCGGVLKPVAQLVRNELTAVLNCFFWIWQYHDFSRQTDELEKITTQFRNTQVKLLDSENNSMNLSHSLLENEKNLQLKIQECNGLKKDLERYDL